MSKAALVRVPATALDAPRRHHAPFSNGGRLAASSVVTRLIPALVSRLRWRTTAIFGTIEPRHVHSGQTFVRDFPYGLRHAVHDPRSSWASNLMRFPHEHIQPATRLGLPRISA